MCACVVSSRPGAVGAGDAAAAAAPVGSRSSTAEQWHRSAASGSRTALDCVDPGAPPGSAAGELNRDSVKQT